MVIVSFIERPNRARAQTIVRLCALVRVRCALRRRVCTRFGFAVAARGGGRRIARLGPCQPVCALRASCGDHAAAGAAGREPPCTSPPRPTPRSGLTRSHLSQGRARVRFEMRSRTRARVARGGPGACEPGHGAGGCASAPAPGVGGAGGGRCGEASFSYRLFALSDRYTSHTERVGTPPHTAGGVPVWAGMRPVFAKYLPAAGSPGRATASRDRIRSGGHATRQCQIFSSWKRSQRFTSHNYCEKLMSPPRSLACISLSMRAFLRAV